VAVRAVTVARDRGGHAGAASDESHPSPERDWPWLFVMWWFLALVAYHLILEHRAHVLGALPYFVAVATLVGYLLLVRHRRATTATGHDLSHESKKPHA
jgi:hypothetical protein